MLGCYLKYTEFERYKGFSFHYQIKLSFIHLPFFLLPFPSWYLHIMSDSESLKFSHIFALSPASFLPPTPALLCASVSSYEQTCSCSGCMEQAESRAA